MPGIEVTQTHFRDQPERGYQASPPQQDGQYPAYAPQGAYPQAGPYTQQGPYQQPYQQQWQPPPQQWGPPGSGQVEYGFCNRPGVSYPVFVAPADMDDNPIFVGTSLPGPFKMECGPCGYRGDPSIRTKIGCGWYIFLMMTFGLSLLCPHWGRDVLIVCPSCNKVEGVAKMM